MRIVCVSFRRFLFWVVFLAFLDFFLFCVHNNNNINHSTCTFHSLGLTKQQIKLKNWRAPRSFLAWLACMHGDWDFVKEFSGQFAFFTSKDSCSAVWKVLFWHSKLMGGGWLSTVSQHQQNCSLLEATKSSNFPSFAKCFALLGYANDETLPKHTERSSRNELLHHFLLIFRSSFFFLLVWLQTSSFPSFPFLITRLLLTTPKTHLIHPNPFCSFHVFEHENSIASRRRQIVLRWFSRTFLSFPFCYRGLKMVNTGETFN